MAIALASPTLGRLVTSVRNLLNQPDAANSFWSDAELTDYINEGVRVYFAQVVQNMEGQWLTTTTLNIVSGAETVALPTDCYEVKKLSKVLSNGRVALDYQNNLTGGVLTNGGASGSETYFPSYSFRGSNLVLNPVPNYSETGGLYLDYVQFPDSLVNPGDTMSANVVPLFKQVVEMYAVYKAKVKESLVNGVDTSAIAKSNLNELYAQFIDSIKNRSKYPQYVLPFSPESY